MKSFRQMFSIFSDAANLIIIHHFYRIKSLHRVIYLEGFV